jgi:RNA polymerase sigma-70 factor (ECF subfamily)
MIFNRDPLADPEKLIRRVYAYAAYRVGDGPDAEDVTSETFERALRYRESYDRSKGEPLGWLIGIARRVIAGRGFESAEIPVAELPDVAAPGAIDEDVTRGVVVRAAVASLDERDRELVALRYGADLTVGQIAELLGLRPNTVDVALHRARKRLAATLDPASEEELSANATEAVRVEGPRPVFKVEGEHPTRGDA